MAMRNFWIEGNVDGRRTQITGGPQGSGGGFSLVVYQRENNTSKVGVRVTGRVVNGELILDVDPGTVKNVRVENNGGFRAVSER
jgi:hypothetical protein